MGTFRVYYDPAALEELCRRTPYNLKKDLKNIDEQTRQEIAEELANEIYLGLDRPPTAVSLHWGRKRQATCAKIRVVDVRRDAGKSNGYRCIVLVDYVHSSAFLLRRTSVGATGISWTDWSMNTSALWRPYRQKKSHKNRKTVWEEVYHDRYQ